MRRNDWMTRYGSFDGLVDFMWRTGFPLEHIDGLKNAYELTNDEAEQMRETLTKLYAEDKKTRRREYVSR